jgi:hypothetical protein
MEDDCGSVLPGIPVKHEPLGGFYRAEDELEHKTTGRFILLSNQEEMTMKFTTIALAGALALTSTFALAQGSNGGGGVGGSVAGSTAGTNTDVNGTGGSPGSNTNNAMSQGTTGNSTGATNTNAGAMNNGNTLNNAPGSSTVGMPNTGQPSPH